MNETYWLSAFVSAPSPAGGPASGSHRVEDGVGALALAFVFETTPKLIVP